MTARSYAVLVLALGLARVASAGNGPVKVAIECEETGRTKACPAFLLGLIDAHPVLLNAPRASADVVVYVNAQEVALSDRVHLRFVGNVRGAPPGIETERDLDSRTDDDTQRAQLEPAFLRGVALYVAARYPGAVAITIGTPDQAIGLPSDTKAWDLSFAVGGFGSWTEKYQSFHGNSGISLSWLRPDARLSAAVSGNGGINRQPPLVLDDGSKISVDTTQWAVLGELTGAWLLDEHWSVGGISRAWRDDPLGQYRYAWNTRAAIEWDHYAANDPRGNRLAIAYSAGYQLEGYNLRDVLGERSASYPVHTMSASGSIRHDQTAIGLSLMVTAEMLDPSRRHSVTAGPFLDWKLGGHIDLNLSLSVTKRQIVAPDETLIDPMNYAQLSRLSYAEPLSVSGSLNITFHWDRTNGARNDRLIDL